MQSEYFDTYFLIVCEWTDSESRFFKVNKNKQSLQLQVMLPLEFDGHIHEAIYMHMLK